MSTITSNTKYRLPAATLLPLFDSDFDAGIFVAGVLLNCACAPGKEGLPRNGLSYHATLQIIQTFSSHSEYTSAEGGVVQEPLPIRITQEIPETFKFMVEFGNYGGGGVEEECEEGECRGGD